METKSLMKLLKWAQKESSEDFKKLASISSLVINDEDILNEETSFEDSLDLNLTEMESLVDPELVEFKRPNLSVSAPK